MAGGKGKAGRGRRKEDEAESKDRDAKEKSPGAAKSLLLAAVTLFTFVLLWAGHYLYLHHLFENHRFFSHLADFEREMLYRTEMGLYYSYYKTLITAPTFAEGVQQLLSDNVTEYGHSINTLQRFNLYPEVMLGAAFRAFKHIAGAMGWTVEHCWRVNRGEGLPPVESCVGVGNPHYFYVNAVFAIAALTLPTLFVYGRMLSSSYSGGILSAAAFAFNHGEATRVMWTPPLRESFAYPLLLVQMLVLSCALRVKRCTPWTFLSLVSLTTLHVLSWQFSGLALATQVGSILVLYTLDLISPAMTNTLLNSLTFAWAISFGLLFGNLMLLGSLFFTSLVASHALMLLRPLLDRISLRPLYVLLHLVIFSGVVVGARALLARVFDIRDDGHVMDLLKAKFTDFANFHTQLYLCALEFDFIEYATVLKLISTWLLPVTAVSIALFLVHFYKATRCGFAGLWRRARGDSIDSAYSGMSMETPYNIVQLACFAAMAVVIMRLKLFATPHLCALASLIASREIVRRMAYQGTQNINEQLAMTGEYNNPEQEHLFRWIVNESPKDAVFAGSMALMANVKLSTLRPIVNHPHYESEEVRNRTLEVYSIYSRKLIDEVYQKLRALRVDFYILQVSSCINSHPKPNCTYIQMWDLIDAENRHGEPVCSMVLRSLNDSGQKSLIQPMHIAYASGDYLILKL